MRELLTNLIKECADCSAHFHSNVGTIIDETTRELTDDQVEALLAHMVMYHDAH